MKSGMQVLFGGAALSVLSLVANAALAQATPDTAAASAAPQDQTTVEEVVVTGTLIRGVAPVGTNVVGLSRDDITASGAVSANDVLSQVPQVTNFFNNVATVLPMSQFYATQRPNLRDLGGDASGTSTLVLMDGHRIVNSGFFTAPDAEVIPPGLLERVDVVPDGGSATYGSDAVGGVINFVTRKRYDGVEARGHYGVADAFETWDASLTAGKDWGSGSIFASYSYLKHDAIFGRDRDYVKQVSINQGYCAPGTAIAGGVTYALPGLAPNTMTDCDNTDGTTIIPKEERHSFFAGATQDLSDTITVGINGYYTRREDITSFDENLSASTGTSERAQSVTLQPSNPSYHPFIPGDTRPQEVRYSYKGLRDPSSKVVNKVFQVTPTLTADLGSGWQLRLLGSYGKGDAQFRGTTINENVQAAGIASGAINPYNLAATSQATLAQLFPLNESHTQQTLSDARAIAEGPLFTLPAGSVRLAVGAEYNKETVSRYQNDRVTAVIDQDDRRNVKAVFGELIVPLISGENAKPLVQELTLSASGRYDDYSDVGDTFNPKFGVTYQPVDWLRLRGNWGTSFNAPSLMDINAPDTRAEIFAFSPFIQPGTPQLPTILRPTVLLAGGNPDLKPQEAETWSLGGDITPARGVKLSATYYNARLTDQFSFPQLPLLFSPGYLGVISYLNPSAALIQEKLAGLRVNGNPAVLTNPANPPYLLLDARRQNLGFVKQDGVDFSAQFDHSTSFGSVNASIGGTYILNRDVRTTPKADMVSALDTPGVSRFSVQASVGAMAGGLTGRLTYSHRAGYDVNPPLNSTLSRYAPQTHIEGFDTVDAFVSYALEGEGLAKDLTLTLNINNIFDADPPFYNEPSPIFGAAGFTNGSTYGRLVQFGVQKKF